MTNNISSSKSKRSRTVSKTGKKSANRSKSAGPRQPSAYLIFCGEQRSRRKAEFANMPPKEIMKSLGAEWRSLTTQQKETYKSKAPNNRASKGETSTAKSQVQRRSSKPDANVISIAKPETSTKHQSMSRKRTESVGK